MTSTTSPASLAAIVGGYHGAPFDVLGIHPVEVDGQPAVAIRAFLPQAAEVAVVREGHNPTPMTRVHPDGFFELVVTDRPSVTSDQLSVISDQLPVTNYQLPITDYRLLITDRSGATSITHDPYRFPPVLSEFDLHLIGEGTHHDLYTKLGAHLCEVEGVPGVCFAVWAPSAEQVSVVGNFNEWDGRRHPMRPRGASGVWEIFLPGLAEWELYKYEIKTRYMGYMVAKADPYGFASELRPQTASVVVDLDRYQWADGEWMTTRKSRNNLQSPISVYEVHLGSWRKMPDPEWGLRYLNYRELAETLVPYVKEMGYTHIELLPITEHPFDGSWGYQTIGYFAPTSRFGTPHDFMYFVDACHQNNIGVILDWVPAHFPKDEHGLAFFDGTHLYEHADPRLGEHQDWGTLIFNFGRNEVRNFLLTSALFWLTKYHIDGLRVDAVASMLYLDYSRKDGEWLPNKYGGRENLEAVDFLKKFNEIVHLAYPDVLTFAEESTAWPMVSRPTYLGGLGFDLKWNMGWMHDMLLYLSKDPIHRRFHHNDLTFSLLYAFTENFILPLSHDEVVHSKGALISKMPGDDWQKFANLRALYGYMFAHPGKKLLFMGGEFGQWNEWNDQTGLDWNLLEYRRLGESSLPLGEASVPHRGLREFVRDLNRLYASEPALYEIDFSWEGFEWIDFRDVDSSIVAFRRRGRSPGDEIVVVANFTPIVREGYRLGVPEPGFYRELLNSDSAYYGGSDVGNRGGVPSDEMPWQGLPHSLQITLPPLGVLFLKKR